MEILRTIYVWEHVDCGGSTYEIWKLANVTALAIGERLSEARAQAQMANGIGVVVTKRSEGTPVGPPGPRCEICCGPAIVAVQDVRLVPEVRPPAMSLMPCGWPHYYCIDHQRDSVMV